MQAGVALDLPGGAVGGFGVEIASVSEESND